MQAPGLTHAEIQLLLADYRDLRGSERREVDAHLATCTACAARLSGYRAMDAALQALPDARPTPALRAGYSAAVQSNGQGRPERRGSARPLRLAYGVVSLAAVLLAILAAWAVLRPSAGAARAGGSGQGSIPPAKSVEVAGFVWQTDGVYGYEMLRPAAWTMADMGTLRRYLAPPGSAGGGSLELQALNLKARPDAPDGTAGVPEGMRELRDRFDATPNLADWAKGLQELLPQNQPPVEQIAEVPGAMIYQQRYDKTSRVATVLFALVVREGQPLILALNAGGSYRDLEALRAGGVWDDFLTMIDSLHPIPPDPNNVAPWAPTATPARQATAPVVSPAPTAAPVTPEAAVEGRRDPEATQVMMDVYSGRPNPAWTLSADQTEALRRLLDALPDAACKPIDLNLGYRGFVVELGQSPLLSNEYRLRVVGGQVRWGDPWTPGAATLCKDDAEGQVASFLLESGREQLGEGLVDLAAREILANTLPGDWQPYVDETLGISLAHPPTWELTQDTGLSRLFHVRQSEPAGPTFPAFYVTQMPHGFTNEDVSAYNFWSEADVAKALALPVGESGEVSGAPGYNVYMRLPDMMVAGLPGVVVESDQFWEAGPGMKDRRVLVARGDATYMFGTYYTTAEELRTFEQVLASLVFLDRPASATPAPTR